MKKKDQYFSLLHLIKTGCTVLLIAFSIGINAQGNILRIDLATALEMGGANNLSIQKYELEKQLALAERTEAGSWWLPDLYAGVAAHQLWGASMNADGRIFTGLNRQNIWAGIGANGHWKLSEGIYAEKTADLRAQAVQFRQESTKNQVLLEIATTYFDFLAAQLQMETYDLLIAQSDTIARQLKIQVDAGLAYQSDWLLAQSNIGHLKVEQLNAQKKRADNMARLIGLLNLPPNTQLVSTEKNMAPLRLIANDQPDADLQQAYTLRPEMKYMDLQRQLLETKKEGLKKSTTLPELSLNVYGATFGDIFSPQRPTAEINAALMWRIPLELVLDKHKGPYKKLDTQLQMQQFETEVFKNKINEELAAAQWLLKTSARQMDISKQSANLAQEAYMQSIERQKSGIARPFEILQTQEAFIRSQLDYLQAVATYNIAQYRIYVALGNNL